MVECVQIARRLGERVGRDLNIPVYLYEQAATRPERINLEDIRRGQYEALKEVIGTDLNRLPDFGPAQLGPAGATIIGARAPLVAFNVYLTTNDLAIAKAVAKAVRFIEGFRFVKALGMIVNGVPKFRWISRLQPYPGLSVVEPSAGSARFGLESIPVSGWSYSAGAWLIAVWYTQLEGFDLQITDLSCRKLSKRQTTQHSAF
jgi:hypothetical protein